MRTLLQKWKKVLLIGAISFIAYWVFYVFFGNNTFITYYIGEFLSITSIVLIAVGLVMMILNFTIGAGEGISGKISDERERKRKLKELDDKFDRWLAQNGGMWILSGSGRLTLERKDWSKVYFDITVNGYDDAQFNYLEHLGKRFGRKYCYAYKWISSGRGFSTGSYTGVISSSGRVIISEDYYEPSPTRVLAYIVSKEAAEEARREAEAWKNKYN